MKINIELNLPGDGRTFLNYWNSFNGDDVVCELIDGKLMLSQIDEESRELPAKEISFIEFLKMVETRGEFNLKAFEKIKNKK